MAVTPRAWKGRHCVAFAGAITGIIGMTMAIVMVGTATSPRAAADPVVSKAVTTASGGGYLVAAMGFAAMLGASGLLTLRTGVFPPWTGIVTIVGAISFLITSLTLLDGTDKDSLFGYGFLPGVVTLVVWSIATSITRYRALGTSLS